MSRKLSREISFKLVFEYEFLNQKNPLTLEDFLVQENLTGKDKEYIKNTYEGVIKNKEKIKQIITANLKGYTFERIYKIDLAILMLATYELKFNKDTTPNVIINEAVELSKIYSTEKSYGFINGVLAQVNKYEEQNE